MDVVLKVMAGPGAGRQIQIPEGRALTVGRTQRADFAIPQDSLLSSVHFAVELRGATWHVIDRKSTNGTFLNGACVTEAVLRDGDQILAGSTTFVVHIVEAGQKATATPSLPATVKSAPSAAANPGALAVGSWSFQVVPEGWEVIEGRGVRRVGKDVFPSNAIASEDPLQENMTLTQYVDSQMNLLRRLLPEPNFDPVGRSTVSGADEAATLVIRYKADDGRPVLQRQVYARSSQLAGVLTFTTTEAEFPGVQRAFDAILSKATFRPK